MLIVLRAASFDEAIELVNAIPYAQRHRDLHRFRRGGAALPERDRGRHGRHQRADPGADGVFSFGGWKSSLFGDLHMHGMEGVDFYTRTKAITTRWPEVAERSASTLTMPTLG